MLEIYYKYIEKRLYITKLNLFNYRLDLLHTITIFDCSVSATFHSFEWLEARQAFGRYPHALVHPFHNISSSIRTERIRLYEPTRVHK